jgi:hypothetical protein
VRRVLPGDSMIRGGPHPRASACASAAMTPKHTAGCNHRCTQNPFGCIVVDDTYLRGTIRQAAYLLGLPEGRRCRRLRPRNRSWSQTQPLLSTQLECGKQHWPFLAGTLLVVFLCHVNGPNHMIRAEVLAAEGCRCSWKAALCAVAVSTLCT